jgi:hypothetical protein
MTCWMICLRAIASFSSTRLVVLRVCRTARKSLPSLRFHEVLTVQILRADVLIDRDCLTRGLRMLDCYDRSAMALSYDCP